MAAEKREYRTSKRAGKYERMPEIIPTPTHPTLGHALKPDVGKEAYLQPTTATITLEHGVLKFNGLPPNDPAKYYITGALAHGDYTMVPVLFGVVKQVLDRRLVENPGNESAVLGDLRTLVGIDMYLPDLLATMGLKKNAQKSEIARIIQEIRSLNSVIGVIEEPCPGRDTPYQSIYPLMVFHGYDEKTNTFGFSSPYMTAIYRKLMEPRIKRDAQGRPRRNGKKEQEALPNYSYMVKTSLYGQRNDRAIDIVEEIVRLIERAGVNGTPNIKVRTLIQRIPSLKDIVDDDTIATRNKGTMIGRAFRTAWKYLDEHTFLKQKYVNLQIPSLVPKMRDLDAVLRFSHQGIRDDISQ